MHLSSISATYQRYLALAVVALLFISVGVFMLRGLRSGEKMPGVETAHLDSTTVSPGVTSNAADRAVQAQTIQQNAEAEIRRAVIHWAEAWSRRDAVAYLTFYAAEFKLPEGMQRADWEGQRQSRLSKYRSIKVNLKNLRISFSAGNVASVRFTQDFHADSYRETGTKKELLLKNVSGHWLIVSEKNI
jgi:ketosteroid isomerase-like protein